MAVRLVLLVLPALIHARINVQIEGQFNQQQGMQVLYTGNEIGIISDKERNTFGLTDENIKQGVEAYFGRRPDDAYVRSPTPWGDLYMSNNWAQVSRTLVPKRGKILKVTSQPMIVMEQLFENNSTKTAVFNVGISTSASNTVKSSWSKSGDLTVGQDINYGFDIELVSFGGSTTFSYTSAWGQSAEKSESITIGSTSAVEILLEPGQSVVAELHSTKGSVQVEMEYEASLSGAVAVNYEDVYKGHHFWSLDVNAVMSYGGLKNTVVSKEVIEIEFFAHSRVVVKDGKMGYHLINVLA